MPSRRKYWSSSSDFDSENKPMPKAEHATAAQTRRPMCSRKNHQLIKPTTAGIAAMITPADTALVMLTPNSMQMENKKLPKNDSKKTSFLVCKLMGGSSAGFLSHRVIAKPPIPKRIQANKKTGKVIDKGLDSAT